MENHEECMKKSGKIGNKSGKGRILFPAVIAVLEDQVAVLKSQLKCKREEKMKRLDRLAMEQEKTKLLMLPQAEPEQVKKANWLGYFRRKR